MNVPGLIPVPLETEMGEGAFTLSPNTTFVAEPQLANEKRWLRTMLADGTGYEFHHHQGGAIELTQSDDMEDEEYSLSIRPKRVRITGGSPQGVFRGCNTLLKLFPADIFRAAPIQNGPWTVPSWTHGSCDCCVPTVRHAAGVH